MAYMDPDADNIWDPRGEIVESLQTKEQDMTKFTVFHNLTLRCFTLLHKQHR